MPMRQGGERCRVWITPTAARRARNARAEAARRRLQRRRKARNNYDPFVEAASVGGLFRVHGGLACALAPIDWNMTACSGQAHQRRSQSHPRSEERRVGKGGDIDRRRVMKK